MSFYFKHKLDNGITLVVEPIKNVRSVAVGFWVGVGSRHETPAEAGVSHFIEHLLFKGTETRTALDISQTFDSLGAELNAFTTKEFTCYYTRLLDEHLETGIQVLADMLQNSLFRSDHIEFERQVVLEEIAMYEDTPDEQIHDLFTASLWPNHPLGSQVLGSKETVGSFTREAVVNYFQRFYTPTNIVVAAAGSVQPEVLVELVQKHFLKAAAPKPVTQELTPKGGGRFSVFTKQTEQTHLCYGGSTVNSRHPDRFALSVLENIIGGGMSSRLFQKVREEKGLAYAIYSYHSLYFDAGNMAIYAGTRKANFNEVLKIIRDELDKFIENGAQPEELSRAKEQIKGQLVLGLESSRNRMTRLGRSELTHGEILSIDELIKRIDAVTADDLKRLAAQIFQRQNMVLTVIGPLKEEEVIEV